MNKPMNYENVSTGDFTPVTPGGHHLIIKQVKEAKSKTGKDMLVVALDMAQNDSQPLYMSKLFEGDTRPEKKWPRAGTVYVVATDNNGQCSRNFKTFISSFEKSNGVEARWVEGTAFVAQFAGKKIGGVYGIVEDEYNGERKKKCELRWFCEDGRAEGAKVPEPKLLDQGAAPVPAGSVPSGFVPVSAEEIPF